MPKDDIANMAFRRTSTDLPKDVEFPASLTKLGFKIDASGCVVDIENPKDFFSFDKYDKHDTNQKRYNAVHKAVRQKVHDILASMGVKPLYIDSSDDNKRLYYVGDKNPEKPSMKVLSSPGFSPSEDKELYVVVGDSNQDLGIWSRKSVLTEGGLNHGSAVGLVTKLRGAAQPTEAKTFSFPVDKEAYLPRVIILNPGELFYSHQIGETMSAASWNDRQREHGLADKHHIAEQYNLLPGHESAGKHVELCLRYFLKPIVGYRTRVNIIAIGDAGEAVLKCLNEIFEAAAADDDLLNTKLAIAMIQPTHNADIVTAPALLELLAKHGQIWEAHSFSKGTLLADVAPELKSSALPSSAILGKEPPTGDIGSAGEDSNENIALDPYFRRANYRQFVDTLSKNSTPLASHCDPVTAEWIKNGSFSQSKEIKNDGTTPGTQLALGNSKQCEGAAQGNTDPTNINGWIHRVESFVEGVDANTALATKPSSFEDMKSFEAMKSDDQKSASPIAPQSHLGPVYNKPNESVSDHTPHEGFSNWTCGSDLAMPKLNKPVIAAEPAPDAELEAGKEDVAVDEHGPDVEPLAMKKTSVAVAEHTKVGITPTSAPICTHAVSQPIPIPARIKAPTTNIADSDKQVAAADAKKTDEQEDCHAYDYHKAPAICPTYSAGIEETTEMIFPAVMEDVVGFFEEQKKLWG
jgi:hypothetical protein